MNIHGKTVSIPLISRFIRAFRTLIHLSDRFEDLTSRLEDLESQLAEANHTIIMQRDLLCKETNGLKQEQNRQGKCIQRLETIDRDYLTRIVNRIRSDEESLEIINRELSIHPKIWGSKKRMNISPDAAVSSCFFNTNSGSITIGDYTFAGSNVSILAGTHDIRLKDFLRREAELTEGCDIIIGRGVWLASGCTVLGPCTIGDHAVIASGAVIKPGTNVPPYSIFGGVPAKQIGSVEQNCDGWQQDEAVLNALKRNDNILFAEGWKHKKPSPFHKPGYWLQDMGIIYVGETDWELFHYMPENEYSEIIISGPEDSIRVDLSGKKGKQRITLPGNGQKYQQFEIKKAVSEEKIMLVFDRNDLNTET